MCVSEFGQHGSIGMEMDKEKIVLMVMPNIVSDSVALTPKILGI